MTFLFSTQLVVALARAGYELYRSKDRRYCFLPEPTTEFSERANYMTAIPALHSAAKWEQGRKSPHGVWVSADTPVVVRNGERCYKVGGAFIPLADRDRRRG